MQPSDIDISKIVNQVINNLKEKNLSSTIRTPSTNSNGNYGIFEKMENAIDSSYNAFSEYRKVSLETRYKIIETIRKVSRENAKLWAEMAQKETGMGRVADKIAKNNLVIEKTPGPEILKPEAESGDRGLSLTERAPYGLIAAITPSTNPTATIINNSISFLSGGNTVVYNFHPAAKNVCALAVKTINKAIIAVGAPENLITSVAVPTLDSGNFMMRHKKVRLVVVTGGPAVVEAAFGSKKKVICAGPGNPPVVIDETADLENAAKQLILGASFDNNLLCIAEKEAFAVDSIMDELMTRMSKNGAVIVNKEQLIKLMKVVLNKEGNPDKKWVGKDAKLILAEIGMNVNDSQRLIICDVGFSHPFVQHELLMPILPIVRVKNVDKGIELAVEAEHRFGHTAMMYSKNIENLHKMACAINTSIFVKNGASVSGLGFEGEGSTTMTIASPTGEGCTDARTFTRLRRCVLKDYFRIV